MDEKLYTISIYTENYVGILHRVTSVFTKRKLNIENISVSPSEVKGIHRFTISLKMTKRTADVVIKQLEKQIDVLGAYVNDDEETIFQELALYKVPATDNGQRVAIERIINEYHARILSFTPEFVVIEKTGHQDLTQELFEKFQPLGLLEFTRSGLAAITKQPKNITSRIKEMEENFSHKKNHTTN
jgi:acetolactate synthase I/III small subunit